MVGLGSVAPLEGRRKLSLVAFYGAVLVTIVTHIPSVVTSSPTILMIWRVESLAAGTPSTEKF